MIAIPNMEKPKNAFDCSVKINPEERRCIYTGEVFEETLSLLTDRPCDDCPLIEVDEELIKKFQESAIVIKAVFNRLKKMVNDSDELKAELMGTNTNLVMFDEPNPTQRNVELYSGCRGCSGEIACPDAFTDVAPLCNGYKGAVK